MNNHAKESLRWIAVVGCGGFGLFYILASLQFMLTRPDRNWLFVLVFGMPTVLLVFSPFVLVAYFCWRRRYRAVLTMLSGVLAIMVFLLLGSLPARTGFTHWLFSSEIAVEHWWASPLALVTGLACLVVPFYIARWIFRFGLRMADRFFPISPIAARPA